MASSELEVKEISELNDVSITDDALALTYTEKDGVGKSSFQNIKKYLGAEISVKTSATSSANGGTNTISVSTRNGETSETKTFSVKNGQGINSITQSESSDANGLRSNQIAITASESKNSVSATIKDGVGIKSASQSTSSSVPSGLNEYTIKLTDGSTSTIKVYNGAAGKDFHIAKTYKSISAMKADFSGTDVETYEFAMIDTGSVEDADTGKLYCKGATEWAYIGDLSGAQGIKGETGNGISAITNTINSDGNIDVTIKMTNGTSKTFTVVNGTNVIAGEGISISDKFQISANKTWLLDFCYPIGSLYWSSKNTNPSSLFGGTWTQIKDKFVLAAGDTYSSGATGGSASVNLTTANLPSHYHIFTPKGSVSSHSHTLNSGNTSSSGTTATAGVRNEAHSHTYTLRGYSNSTWVYDGSFMSKATNNYVTDGSSTSTGSTTTKSYIYGQTDATTPTFTGSGGTTSSVGSGAAFSILPPYVVKYCWERTA